MGVSQVEVGSLSPIFYKVSCMPGGWPWGFWTINSRIHETNDVYIYSLNMNGFCFYGFHGIGKYAIHSWILSAYGIGFSGFVEGLCVSIMMTVHRHRHHHHHHHRFCIAEILGWLIGWQQTYSNFAPKANSSIVNPASKWPKKFIQVHEKWFHSIRTCQKIVVPTWFRCFWYMFFSAPAKKHIQRQ